MNIIDKTPLLTPAQKSLLERCARSSFRLGGFMSLDDIVTKLKVDVFIEPGIPERSVADYYEKAIDYWRKVHKQLAERARKDKSLWNECQKAEIILGRLNSERKAHSQMSLLGLYDSQKNTIKLFSEAMVAADANKMDEYLVSTLAHEVMHAYFNRPQHEKYPYAMFVEEPLAEFGMLLYLHETHSKYYDWAHDNVSGKKCCYGYGAVIMDQYLGGDKSLKTYLEEYKIPIGEYQMPEVSNSRVSIPKINAPADINGQIIIPQWQDLFNNPPRYFYDEPTETLGLDGEWNNEILHHNRDKFFRFAHTVHRFRNLYLGDNFYAEDRYSMHFFHYELKNCNIVISPANPYYKMVNGIVMSISDGEVAPIYEPCGRDRYCIPKNGKYGVFDCRGTQIVPCKYDSIWSFHENGLCMVRLDVAGGGYLYGYVNEQGEEQIPIEYENVYSFENGVTTAKKDGCYGIIDEHNNIVHPFDLDYPDMRGIYNGFATMRGQNGKWGAIDSMGKVVIPCIYDSLVDFDEDGLAKVKQNGEVFIIDKFGNRKDK